MTFGKNEIHDLLTERGIVFAWEDHQAVYTMEDTRTAGLEHGDCICKNLFLRDGKGRQHYLAVVAGDKRVSLKELGEQIGAKGLSLASAERLARYLGVTRGCVSPLGVLNDTDCAVTVVFDTALRDDTQVGVHPNDNTATVWIRFADLRTLISEHGNPIRTADFAE